MTDKIVTGTFGATGQSATAEYKNFFVHKTGAATATVDVEYQVNGAWYVHTAALADDTPTIIELPFPVPVRLNCSAYTSGTVTYVMAGKHF
jgi:hypothetical protein